MVLTIKYETDGYGNYFHNPLSIYAKAVRIIGALPTNGDSANFGYLLIINGIEYWISKHANAIIPINDIIKNISCKIYKYHFPSGGTHHVSHLTIEIIQ